jgi:hypothetical protein
MYDLVPLLVFLLIVVVYISTQKKTTNLSYAVLAVAAILAVCYFDMREKFTNYAPVNHKLGKCDGLDVKDWRTRPSHLSYDNMLVNIPAKPDHKLLSETTIFTPVGDGVKLTSDPASQKFGTVDGDPNSPKQLFMLAHNQCSPGCCPSTYSCSNGCVCTTNKQRNLINTRGGNQRAGGNPDI